MEHQFARCSDKQAILEMDLPSPWGDNPWIRDEPPIWARHGFLTNKSISIIKNIALSLKYRVENWNKVMCFQFMLTPVLPPGFLLKLFYIWSQFLFKPWSGEPWIMWNLEIKILKIIKCMSQTKLGCAGRREAESNGSFYLKYFIFHGPPCSRWKCTSSRIGQLLLSWLSYL